MAASKLSQLDINDLGYTMVAAIDFGTTYSCYAFSFKYKPKDINMNKNWGDNLGFQSYKTPTSVLTGPDHKFVAFGYEAEQRYADPEDGRGKQYLYRHFKMLLHQEKHLTRTTKVVSTNGHIRPAMDIFVMAIRYLKDHLLETVGKAVASAPDASLVRWVITVPAIWSDEAKNFMREAAFKAGCITEKDSKQLVIALEPEAASLYCRELDISEFTVAENVLSLNFNPKTKYIVIDAGGGTIDITSHEILQSGDLKELHIANGGAWGGKQVDENFVKLLTKILGTDFINAYKQQCPENWLNILTAFEIRKKAIKPDGESKISIQLPWTMGSKYFEISKGNIEQILQGSSKIGVSFQNGSIVLNHEASMDLFQPVTADISRHLHNLFKLPIIHPLSCILLVGGFGESPVLQKAIQNMIPSGVKLLVPSEAQLSVIKGAISFCHNTKQIFSRIAKKSYGYRSITKFIEGVHDESRKIHSDRGVRCKGVFNLLVKKGDQLEVGKSFSYHLHPVNFYQTGLTTKLVTSDSDQLSEVEYIDNPKFESLGILNIKSPLVHLGTERRFKVDIEFGGTEILVTGIDLASGSKAETSFDLIQ